MELMRSLLNKLIDAMYIGIFAFGKRVELAIVIELIIIIILIFKQGAFSEKGVFRTAI